MEPGNKIEPPPEEEDPPATRKGTVDLTISYRESYADDTGGSGESLGINEASVVGLCRFVLERIGLPGCDLSVSLVGDDEISILNEEYFGKDRPTDVISFPMEEKARDGALLGDVVVCVPQAVRVAGENGLPMVEELSLYLIHGILHLAGDRDDTPESRERMKSRQEKLLSVARDAGKLITVVGCH